MAFKLLSLLHLNMGEITEKLFLASAVRCRERYFSELCQCIVRSNYIIIFRDKTPNSGLCVIRERIYAKREERFIRCTLFPSENF